MDARGRHAMESSGDDEHQHGEDDERRGIRESDSDGCFGEHDFSLLIEGRGTGVPAALANGDRQAATSTSTTRTASDAA